MTKDIHPKIKWYRVSSRGKNHAVLIIDSMIFGNDSDYVKKIYGVDYKVKYYRQFDKSRWISDQDYQDINNIFRKLIKEDSSLILKLANAMEETSNTIINESDRYKETNWIDSSNEDLAKVVERFFDLEARLWGSPVMYGWYFFFNDIYLEELKNDLKNKFKDEDFDRIWNYATTPEKLTFIGQEKLELLKLAEKVIKNEIDISKGIEEHHQRFAFVNKYYFWGDGARIENVKEQLEELINKGIEYIEAEIKNFKKESLDIKQYSLSKEMIDVINGFRKMAYVANLADEATNYFTYYLKPLYQEAAKRLEISYEELASMRFEEIEKSLKDNSLAVSKKEVTDRYHDDHAFVYLEGDKFILTGLELEDYKKVELEDLEQEIVKEIKGTVAFKRGIVQGKVQIIKDGEEGNSFEEGNILVTQMTNPTYLPAMKKSKAIITDEGGMLCHAAIVSRELKIPCVIGTKIATKVLKDGDLVNVDATNGIVTIIK